MIFYGTRRGRELEVECDGACIRYSKLLYEAEGHNVLSKVRINNAPQLCVNLQSRTIDRTHQ